MNSKTKEIDNIYRYIESIRQKVPAILEQMKNDDIEPDVLSTAQAELRKVIKQYNDLLPKTKAFLRTLSSSEIVEAYGTVCSSFRIIIGVHMETNFKKDYLSIMVDAIRLDYEEAYHFLRAIGANHGVVTETEFLNILTMCFGSQHEAMLEVALAIAAHRNLKQFIPNIETIASKESGTISDYAKKVLNKVKAPSAE